MYELDPRMHQKPPGLRRVFRTTSTLQQQTDGPGRWTKLGLPTPLGGGNFRRAATAGCSSLTSGPAQTTRVRLQAHHQSSTSWATSRSCAKGRCISPRPATSALNVLAFGFANSIGANRLVVTSRSKTEQSAPPLQGGWRDAFAFVTLRSARPRHSPEPVHGLARRQLPATAHRLNQSLLAGPGARRCRWQQLIEANKTPIRAHADHDVSAASMAADCTQMKLPSVENASGRQGRRFPTPRATKRNHQP